MLSAAGTSDARAAVRCAAEILQAGGVVAFPTETVYGLGADARDAAAVKKIFKAKKRPGDNPLIVHVSALAQVESLVREIPPRGELLARHFWPGPLTLVLPKSDLLPAETTAGLNSVAVRVPAHPLALLLLETAALPVAAPSANLSGSPSPTTADHVLADLAGRIDAVLDGGACEVGVESTVLSLLTSPPALLRPGGVTLAQLCAVLGEEVADLSSGAASYEGTPPSPGMKYRHYAPHARLLLVEAGTELEQRIATLAAAMQHKGVTPGLLLTTETAAAFTDFSPLEVLGSQQDPEAVARQLYGAMRRLDSMEIDVIIAEGLPAEDIGLALMNRLRKAASCIYPAPEQNDDKG